MILSEGEELTVCDSNEGSRKIGTRRTGLLLLLAASRSLEQTLVTAYSIPTNNQ